MIDFNRVKQLPGKIKRNGMGWLKERTKAELINPRFVISKIAIRSLEHFRRLFRERSVRTLESIESEDTLLVIYDLNFSPITFDFAFFLAAAESYGKLHGRTEMRVFIVLKEPTVLISEEYEHAVSQDSQKWRLQNVVLQLANLYGGLSNYTVLPSSGLDPYLHEAMTYPPGYSRTYKPTHEHAEIFALLNRKEFTGFQSLQTGLNYIDQWMLLREIDQPIVVITLRQYGYDTARNSNIEE